MKEWLMLSCSDFGKEVRVPQIFITKQIQVSYDVSFLSSCRERIRYEGSIHNFNERIIVKCTPRKHAG